MRRVPHSSNERESRTDSTLKNTEEESKDHQTSEIVCDRVESEDNAPDEPMRLGLVLYTHAVLGNEVHENAEIFSKRELDETEGDGVRGDEVAEVEDTGCPAELLANEFLVCTLVPAVVVEAVVQRTRSSLSPRIALYARLVSVCH